MHKKVVKVSGLVVKLKSASQSSQKLVTPKTAAEHKITSSKIVAQPKKVSKTLIPGMFFYT